MRGICLRVGHQPMDVAVLVGCSYRKNNCYGYTICYNVLDLLQMLKGCHVLFKRWLTRLCVSHDHICVSSGVCTCSSGNGCVLSSCVKCILHSSHGKCC